MGQAPPTLAPQPLPHGVACRHCGATETRTTWQTFSNGTKHVRADCARCGKFVRYLRQDGEPEFRYEKVPATAHAASTKPPPSNWTWLGLIRLSDGVWRPVAHAPTLARCWDSLLCYPADGDRLCIPSRQEPKESSSDPS